MSLPTGRLRRSDRLLSSRDFRRVAKDGVRVASQDFVMLVADAREPSAMQIPTAAGCRLGVTTSRKVGHAVTRNRVKRAIREWFRASRDELDTEVDVVVIARSGAAYLRCGQLSVQLSDLAERARRVRY